MHSHDRTLLARLGFNDPDRRDQRHDLACAYLREPTVASAVLTQIASRLDTIKIRSKFHDEEYESGARSTSFHKLISAKSEAPLSKGEGQYKTTIGFLDVLWKCKVEVFSKGRKRNRKPGWGEEWTEWIEEVSTDIQQVQYCGEVKITPTPASDIIRQINLYREYLPAGVSHTFALIAGYEMSALDVTTLRDHNILPMDLDAQNFDSFCARAAQWNPIRVSV